jgi:hypothetical protein
MTGSGSTTRNSPNDSAMTKKKTPAAAASKAPVASSAEYADIQPPQHRQREGGEHNAGLVAHSGDKRREPGAAARSGGAMAVCYDLPSDDGATDRQAAVSRRPRAT